MENITKEHQDRLCWLYNQAKSKLMLSFLMSTGRCFVYAGWKENLVNKGASLLPVLNYLLKLIVVSNKSLWSDVAEEFLEWL